MATSVPQILALGAALLGSRITQFFGPTNYAAEPANFGYPHFHTGVDIVLPDSPHNPPVRAVSSGVVEAVIPSSTGFGNHILVRSPNGFTYLYGHLHDFSSLLYNSGRQSGLNLRVGDQVHVGDVIGHEGTTGNSSGNHLHLEVYDPNHRPIDLGRTPQAIIYSLYHDLGWGAGYLPGQNPDFIPSATQPGPSGTYSQVPLPLPLNPDLAHSPSVPGGPANLPGDVRFTFGQTPTHGPSDPTGITGGQPGDPSQPGGIDGGPAYYDPGSGYYNLPNQGVSNFFSFLGQPGGIFNSGWKMGQEQQSGSTIDPGKILVFAGTVVLGGMFVLIGLVKLGGEKPVQVVVSPVVSTAKTGAAVAAAA